MKKIKLLIVMLIVLSCSNSNNLSKSLAKSIFEKCLEKEGGLFETIDFPIGKSLYLVNSELKRLQEVENKGYVKLQKKGNYYDVELTNKGEDNLDKIDRSIDFQNKVAKIKAVEYGVDKIEEIHIIPDKNIANVKILFGKKEGSDLEYLVDESKEEKSITVKYRKTTDGWSLCN